MNVKSFKKRYDAARKLKLTNWETLYREAMELFCPNRENFYKSISGEKKGRQVYTASPYIALDKSSNNMHASLTPHQKKWVNLRPGRLIPEEVKDQATKVLIDIRDTMFDHIFTSNFDLAVSEFYKDLCIGTGALLVNGTSDNPLIFTSIPLEELYILPGALGTVDTVFRKYKISYGNIQKTWEDAKLTDDMKRMVTENPDKEIEVLEGTVPKTIKVWNAEIEREEEKEGYGYYVCVKNGDHYIVERDMPISPWIVARWSLMSGEVWGRGPAIIALNDAKTLNQFVRLHMQSMEITVHPMYTVVDDGVINIHNIRIGPGKMIPVSANDGAFGATIKPLPSGGNFQAGQMELERLEASINDQLYTEPLGPVNLPVKTATEISIRQQELAKRIGSAYGRLQYEFIKQIVQVCLYQLERFNIIDMADFKVDGHTVSVDAQSPLAQGQSEDEVNNLIRYVEFAIGAFGPQVGLTLLKPDEILKFIGEHLSIPPEIQINEQDKAQMMQILSQLSIEQMQQGQGQANGQQIQQQ